jgi:hypothetical protein
MAVHTLFYSSVPSRVLVFRPMDGPGRLHVPVLLKRLAPSATVDARLMEASLNQGLSVRLSTRDSRRVYGTMRRLRDAHCLRASKHTSQLSVLFRFLGLSLARSRAPFPAAALQSHSVANATMKRLACLVEWLCSGRTSDGTAGASVVGVAPEQLQKESNHYAPSLETPEQVSKLQDPKASEESMPAPSVVVPWVLQDLAASIDLYRLHDNQGVYMRKALYEAHAERLLRCWSEHEQEFPGSLSQELLTFLRTKLISAEHGIPCDLHAEREVRKVVAFLVAFFCEDPLSSAEHKQGLNGKSLWPPVLAALAKQATVPTKESDLDAGWQEDFFLKEFVSMTSSRQTSQRALLSERNLGQLRQAVHQLIEDRTKAKEKALTDAAKASLNRAPWEVVTTLKS